MFYLTTHSTHYVYGYIASDSEKKPAAPNMSYSFWIAGTIILYASSHRQDNMAFVTPVVEHWLEREIAQWVHHEESIWRPITPWANALTTELYLAPR